MNLTLRRGDDKTWEITVKRKDTGAVVDITDCVLTMTVRPSINGDVFFQGIFTLTDPTNGVAEVNITGAVTEGLENKSHEYIYDVEIEKRDHKKENLVVGKFLILPTITHS